MAVARIAHDGMADAGELDPDLVLAPGLEEELEEGESPALAEHSPARERALRPPLAGLGALHESRFPLFEPGVAGSCSRLHLALDEGDIAAFRDDIVPGAHEFLLRSRAAREDDGARSVTVDPVHDSGPALGIASPNFIRGYVEEASGSGAVGRNDRQARWLVVGEDLLVLVEEAGPRDGRTRRSEVLLSPFLIPAGGAAGCSVVSGFPPPRGALPGSRGLPRVPRRPGGNIGLASPHGILERSGRFSLERGPFAASLSRSMAASVSTTRSSR
jgi:hypothetical protein